MGDLGATALLYSARPSIRLDGIDEPDLADGLMSLCVQETTEGLYCCEATFGNWSAVEGTVGYLYFDRRTLEFGRQLAVTMGKGDAEAVVFEGQITAVEGRYPHQTSPEILILAEDRLQDLRMIRRSRTFENTSDQEVFESIARQHSLRTDVQVEGPSYEILAQVNQSDLAFVRQRARVIDAELWIEDGTLHVQQRAERTRGDVRLTYGQGLREFSVIADLAEQRTAVSVCGWDRAEKKPIVERAGTSEIEPELEGGESGSQILQATFGVREERIVHTVPLTSDEARYHARSRFRQMSRRFVRGRGRAEGDGRIRVGTRVELNQLGTLFDGIYFVTDVKHAFTAATGYQTYFSVERPGLGGQ